MKASKWRRRLLCLAVALGMLVGMLPSGALAAGEAAVIDVSGGRVTIEPDGYTVGSGAKVSHSGAYVLTGNGNAEVYFNNGGQAAHTYEVTLRNMKITAGSSHSALSLQNGVTLNLTVEGDNLSKGDNHPGMQIESGSGQVNITLTQDSRLVLDSASARPASVAANVAVHVTNTTGVSGLGGLSNRNEKLTLGTGALHDHEADSWTQVDAKEHSGTCTICGQTVNRQHENQNVSNGEQGHTPTCSVCGARFEQQAHRLDYYDISASEHVAYCEDCDYESAPQAHRMGAWKRYSATEHVRKCEDCGYNAYEAHTWDEGRAVEATPDQVAGTLYTCTACGATRMEENPDGAMEVKLGESYGDSWEGAALLIYRDGTLWRTLSITDYDVYEQRAYLPYEAGRCYVFEWQKGNYDDECSVAITLPGESSPSFEKTDFDAVKPDERVFALNLADYTQVEQAIGEVPEDLEFYTRESVDALLAQIDAVNLYLGASRQAEVDGYADNIRAAIAALEKQAGSSGYLNLKKGDLYISSTGYRWGQDGEETAFTGNYTLTGTSQENHVTVESGSPAITLTGLNLNADDGQPAFAIAPGAAVEMTVKGKNQLISDHDEVAGLNVPEGAALHILQESSGSLYVYGGDDAAGIGGSYDENAGAITIDGGNIKAVSEGDGGGIGGGYGGNAGTIVINGGEIWAECLDDDGAGIGSGDDASGVGSVTINGGKVTALSLDDNGAGLGGGEDDGEGGIVNVTINGGWVTAGSDDGAAIGAGVDGYCGTLTINGGVIEISSRHKDAVTLGSPDNATEGENNRVIINGGSFIANGRNLSTSIQPAPKDAQGRKVFPSQLTVPEELANEMVLLTLPDGSQRVEQAIDGVLVTFLPEEVSAQDVLVGTTGADYSAVDAAIAKVPEDLSGYTPESVAALQAALDAVVRGLDYTHQDEVDGFAAAIEAAIAGLEKAPVGQEEGGQALPTPQPLEQETTNTPATGDSGMAVFVMAALCALAVCGGVLAVKKRKGRG